MVGNYPRVCPHCNTVLSQGDPVKVCPACGVPYHAKCWAEHNGCSTPGCPENHSMPRSRMQQSAAPMDICLICGAPMAQNQAFCTNCGNAKQTNSKVFCSNCRAEIQQGHDFCPKCGQRVGAPASGGPGVTVAVEPQKPQKAKKSKKILPIAIGAVVVVLALILALVFSGPKVEEILLNKTEISLRVDESTTVSYSISPRDASDTKVKWTTSNSGVATVSETGRITAVGEGRCTITVTAGKQSDTLVVIVKNGPDLLALYNKFCNTPWAEVGADGTYLSLDTNPYNKDDRGLDYPAAWDAVQDINAELGLPESLNNAMLETTGADGKQTATYEDVGIVVTWRYHPDKGLEVTYALIN